MRAFYYYRFYMIKFREMFLRLRGNNVISPVDSVHQDVIQFYTELEGIKKMSLLLRKKLAPKTMKAEQEDFFT